VIENTLIPAQHAVQSGWEKHEEKQELTRLFFFALSSGLRSFHELMVDCFVTIATTYCAFQYLPRYLSSIRQGRIALIAGLYWWPATLDET
jgi:hypothetical protein